MEELEALLLLQGGVVLHAQAVDLGVRRRDLGKPEGGQLLSRVRPGAYALASAYDGATVAVRTAIQVAAERAITGVDLVAVGATAARMQDLPVLGTSTRLHLRERPDERPRHHGNSASLPSGDVCLVLGVPATTLPRTAVDVARRGGFAAGVVTADAVLRRSVPREELLDVLARAARWPGARQARRAVAFADSRAESALESLGRVRMHEGGLPPPELQVTLSDPEGPFACVDHYWEEFQTVGEADGALKYTTPETLFAEKRREDRIRDTGREVVRYTWDEALHAPAIVTARFRRAFARRGRLAS